jgi:integrase
MAARKIKLTRRFRWAPKATQGEVPMCETVRKMLRRLEAAGRGNFVFAHRDGGSCRLQLWEMTKLAQKRAGIGGNLRLHDLRHTFAVRLRQRGTPLEVIMGLMRHADMKETLICAPYHVQERASAISVLDR